MNNFFLDSSDYSLFLKALKRTKKEPVVINILSTDESLISNNKKEDAVAMQRKSMSSKFAPSPFGKYFGPRKQNVAVDMKDFSSWKNKNYRKVEQSLGQTKDIDTNFSMSQFMTEKATEGKFNPIDQIKTETNKSIDQLSTDDPLYKRFSLDSYMAKLEQQSAVKDEFEVNDDILEPLGADTQQVVPDSSQDENFSTSSGFNVEKLAFDEHLAGETFSFEREELDKVKTRLEKIEKESKNISDKPKDKVITSDDMNELTGKEKKDDDFGGLLDEEDLDINESLDEDNEPTKIEETPKVKGKKFIQINKTGSNKEKVSTDIDDESLNTNEDSTGSTFETFEETNQDSDLDDNNVETVDVNDSDQPIDEDLGEDFDFDKSDEVSESDDEDDESVSIDEVVDTGEELDSDEDFIYIDVDEPQSSIKKTKLKRSDILTKDDVRSITDEFMAKFAEMNKKETPEQTQPYGYSQHVVDPYDSDDLVDVNGYNQDAGEDTELKSKIQELIDSNKRNDEEMAEKLEMAERQKAIVAEEYESRIKEMEESFKKHYDDVRKKAYLEKLDSDIKLQEAEMKFKKKADDIKEQEKISSQKDYAGAILKRELKSNINISNLEVDKKLLEIASLKNKQHLYKIQETENEDAEEVKKTTTKKKTTTTKKSSSTKKSTSKSSSSTKKKTSTKTTQAKKKTTRRKPTTTTRRPSTRRKIDSDIIGGIKFD